MSFYPKIRHECRESALIALISFLILVVLTLLLLRATLKEQFFSGEIKGVVEVDDLSASLKLEEYLSKKVREFSYFPFC
ncbi:MAG: hypothetical protein HGB23_02350 [Chlorobiaceae bacterium]|nr:hypothetical protein [Chlorobiaceae bacterium]